ncbi:hypothetical protein [Mucilaginibacter oryzae]|uniref:hypothetical protein n=1 Tax=Mucilaginibacter oryzae TaxID=468058 RepID=UPI0014747B06|nr:hypothetical protein [Mucilaginibacter oryzae]
MSIPVVKAKDKRKTAVFTADQTRIIKFPNGKANQQLAVSSNPLTTPIIISRLAEMYLIKAEAQGASKGAVTLAPYFVNRYKLPPSTSSVAALTATQYQGLLLDDVIVNSLRRGTG